MVTTPRVCSISQETVPVSSAEGVLALDNVEVEVQPAQPPRCLASEWRCCPVIFCSFPEPPTHSTWTQVVSVFPYIDSSVAPRLFGFLLR